MTAMRSRPDLVGIEPAGDARALSLSPADVDALVHYVDGAYVVLVKLAPTLKPAALEAGPTPQPVRYRRRVFLSVAAAERAVRAAAARGETARLFLAELKPLHVVRGWEE